MLHVWSHATHLMAAMWGWKLTYWKMYPSFLPLYLQARREFKLKELRWCGEPGCAGELLPSDSQSVSTNSSMGSLPSIHLALKASILSQPCFALIMMIISHFGFLWARRISDIPKSLLNSTLNHQFHMGAAHSAFRVFHPLSQAKYVKMSPQRHPKFAHSWKRLNSPPRETLFENSMASSRLLCFDSDFVF